MRPTGKSPVKGFEPAPPGDFDGSIVGVLVVGEEGAVGALDFGEFVTVELGDLVPVLIGCSERLGDFVFPDVGGSEALGDLVPDSVVGKIEELGDLVTSAVGGITTLGDLVSSVGEVETD